MSLQVEKLEKNMVKLTIETEVEEFDTAIEKAYRTMRKQISVPGFRKGKAPRYIIEKMYGPEVFYEDAANGIIPDAYEKAVKESGLEIVSQPEVDVVQIEKGKSFIFTAQVAIKPEVTLGEYKGVKVPKTDVSVSEEEVAKELERVRNQNARLITVEDGEAIKDDQAIIDFEGFVDGVSFEGGKGENYSLTLGSGSFIPGFEDQLIGKKVGEELEINVTFPDNYQSEELAGKPAVFNVTIKEIKRKELLELDDDFAQDVSEFDSLEEYRQDIKKTLEERKKAAAKTAKENAVVAKIIENAQMEIPDAMLDTQARQMMEDFTDRITSQGMTMEQYYRISGLNPARLRQEFRPQALQRIQNRLVLEAVVKAEDINPTEEEIEEAFAKMAAGYQMDVEKVKELFDGEDEKKAFAMDVAVQKAIDLVTEAAQETEMEEDEKENSVEQAEETEQAEE